MAALRKRAPISGLRGPSPAGEAEAAAAAAGGISGGGPQLSFSCQDGRRISQETFRGCGKRVAGAAQVWAVGVSARRRGIQFLAGGPPGGHKPLVVYPNSGERWDAARHCWVEGEQAEGFGALPLGGSLRAPGSSEVAAVRGSRWPMR